MLDQFFINAGHLYKFPPQNINLHVYEHRQAVDMAGPNALGLGERSMFVCQKIKHRLPSFWRYQQDYSGCLDLCTMTVIAVFEVASDQRLLIRFYPQTLPQTCPSPLFLSLFSDGEAWPPQPDADPDRLRQRAHRDAARARHRVRRRGRRRVRRREDRPLPHAQRPPRLHRRHGRRRLQTPLTGELEIH